MSHHSNYVLPPFKPFLFHLHQLFFVPFQLSTSLRFGFDITVLIRLKAKIYKNVILTVFFFFFFVAINIFHITFDLTTLIKSFLKRNETKAEFRPLKFAKTNDFFRSFSFCVVDLLSQCLFFYFIVCMDSMSYPMMACIQALVVCEFSFAICGFFSLEIFSFRFFFFTFFIVACVYVYCVHLAYSVFHLMFCDYFAPSTLISICALVFH